MNRKFKGIMLLVAMLSVWGATALASSGVNDLIEGHKQRMDQRYNSNTNF